MPMLLLTDTKIMKLLQGRCLFFCRILLPLLAFFILLLSAEGAYSSELKIELKDSLFSIEAREAPLADVLGSIAERTGISIDLMEPLDDAVSCEMKETTLEDILRRLLGSRSYILTYGKTSEGQSYPASLQVLGRRETAPAPIIAAHSPPPEANIPNTLDRYWLENHQDNLAAQLEVIPTNQGTLGRGILISRIEDQSPLLEWGLREGDVIDDVNGVPVGNREEFLQEVTKAARTHGMIRISRQGGDKMTNPIYLRAE